MATLHAVFPILLDSVGHWTLTERVRGLETLCVVLRILADQPSSVSPYLPRLVDTLASTLPDDEVEVRKAAEKVGEALGATQVYDMVLELVLPRLRGELPGMDTAQHRTAATLILATMLRRTGVALQDLLASLDIVTEAICHPSVLCQGSETEQWLLDGRLADALHEVVHALVYRLEYQLGQAEGSLGDHTLHVRRMLRVLTQLQAAPHASVNEGLEGDADEAVVVISMYARCSVEDLYRRHASGVLQMILSASSAPAHARSSNGAAHDGAAAFPPKWRMVSPLRRAFDALVRRAAPVLGTELDAVVVIVVKHVGEKDDPDLKLAMMCLLEILLSTEELRDHWSKYARTIIKEALVHNMVWRAGRVASTVRKVALACYFSILFGKYADQACLFETAPTVLPILKTNLDDYDASSREIVCKCLAMLFIALPGAFGDQPVQELYPALLKRLDDSADSVRLAVCATLEPFFTAAPAKAFQGTCIDYTLDQLFVHLDDMDPEIQGAVFRVIKAALHVDPQKAVKKANNARPSHRSPRFLDELIEEATKLQSA